MVRALIAMSGGVDSSVAAALAMRDADEVVGVTLRLWGGPSDAGCCSVADVEDARRVAGRLGIDHHVFDLSEDFDTHVVRPYIEAHRDGTTPNPCIECNRHLKFDRLLKRAERLGFDLLVTGHHARVTKSAAGVAELRRGRDSAKDQSYVLSMLSAQQLEHISFPVGEMTKSKVRELATELQLPTAEKPDSLDTCFIPKIGGRERFLQQHMAFRPSKLVEESTSIPIGEGPPVELVTIGQRRGLGHGSDGDRRYALAVDPVSATVVVGPKESLMVRQTEVRHWQWVSSGPSDKETLEVQLSAHGHPLPCRIQDREVLYFDAQRRNAPGQTVVVYRGDQVIGSGIAT